MTTITADDDGDINAELAALTAEAVASERALAASALRKSLALRNRKER